MVPRICSAIPALAGAPGDGLQLLGRNGALFIGACCRRLGFCGGLPQIHRLVAGRHGVRRELIHDALLRSAGAWRCPRMVSCPRFVPLAEVSSRVPLSLPEMSWPRLAPHWRSRLSGRTAGSAVRGTTTAPALPAVAGVLGGPADAGTARRPAVLCRRPALRTHKLDMVGTCPSYIPRRCCHRKGNRRNASGPVRATSSAAALPEVPDRAF